MTTERRCDTCKHWTPPSERTSYRSAVDADYVPFVNEGDAGRDEYLVKNNAAYAVATEADKAMGECQGIPFCPSVSQMPSPAASVIDGSQYFAQVYTGPDFFCALWTEGTRG